jgi:hypothetical protein
MIIPILTPLDPASFNLYSLPLLPPLSATGMAIGNERETVIMG